ncbi:hypothetical protein PQX77_015985 [Marasmius sp. AFHP31]|nr:hypothetical protein PQX77_015985 [Marasmius sp. AFHP31]
MTGIMDFLSLYNFIQFGSLLWPEQYEDKKLCMQHLKIYQDPRADGNTILDWLDNLMLIEAASTDGYLRAKGTYGASYNMDITQAWGLCNIRTSYLTQQLLALDIAMNNLPPGSCSSLITQLKYRTFLMKDMTCLPSVNAWLQVFYSSDHPRPSGYPLPDVDLLTYAWEHRHLKDRVFYQIIIRSMGGLLPEDMLDGPMTLCQEFITNFTGNAKKKTHLKKIWQRFAPGDKPVASVVRKQVSGPSVTHVTKQKRTLH